MDLEDGIAKVALSSFSGWGRPAEPAAAAERAGESSVGDAVASCQAAARATAGAAAAACERVPSVSWLPPGHGSSIDAGDATPWSPGEGSISDEFRVFLDHIGLRGPTVQTILRALERCEVNQLDVWLDLNDAEMDEVREELRAAGVSVGVRYTLRTQATSARVNAWRTASRVGGSGGGQAAAATKLARPAKVARATKAAPANSSEPGRRRVAPPPTVAPRGQAPPKVVPWNIPAPRSAVPLHSAGIAAAKPRSSTAKPGEGGGATRAPAGALLVEALAVPTAQLKARPLPTVGLQASGAAAKAVAAAAVDCKACRGAHCKHVCGRQKVGAQATYMTELSTAAKAVAGAGKAEQGSVSSPSPPAEQEQEEGKGSRSKKKDAAKSDSSANAAADRGETSGGIPKGSSRAESQQQQQEQEQEQKEGRGDSRFEVGARVQAQYSNGHWYDAIVKSVSSRGGRSGTELTYTIDWNDGAKEQRAHPARRIRARGAAAAAAGAAAQQKLRPGSTADTEQKGGGAGAKPTKRRRNALDDSGSTAAGDSPPTAVAPGHANQQPAAAAAASRGGGGGAAEDDETVLERNIGEWARLQRGGLVLGPVWRTGTHGLMGKRVSRHFISHKTFTVDSTSGAAGVGGTGVGRIGDADQYKTQQKDETPKQIAAKIGCSVADLLLINNQRPCFEKTLLRPSTKLLKHTWLLQPLPQTFLGVVVGFRPHGRQMLFRVVDTQDSVGYVVEEQVLRRAIAAGRPLVEDDLEDPSEAAAAAAATTTAPKAASATDGVRRPNAAGVSKWGSGDDVASSSSDSDSDSDSDEPAQLKRRATSVTARTTVQKATTQGGEQGRHRKTASSRGQASAKRGGAKRRMDAR